MKTLILSLALILVGCGAVPADGEDPLNTRGIPETGGQNGNVWVTTAGAGGAQVPSNGGAGMGGAGGHVGVPMSGTGGATVISAGTGGAAVQPSGAGGAVQVNGTGGMTVYGAGGTVVQMSGAGGSATGECASPSNCFGWPCNSHICDKPPAVCKSTNDCYPANNQIGGLACYSGVCAPYDSSRTDVSCVYSGDCSSGAGQYCGPSGMCVEVPAALLGGSCITSSDCLGAEYCYDRVCARPGTVINSVVGSVTDFDLSCVNSAGCSFAAKICEPRYTSWGCNPMLNSGIRQSGVSSHHCACVNGNPLP